MEKYRYIYGNHARDLDLEPEIEVLPKVGPGKKPQKTTRKIRENRQRHMQMNLFYAMGLTVATLAFAVISVQHIQVRFNLTYQIRQIEHMERELIQLTRENDFNAAGLNNHLDLEQIERIAREELNMVPASPEQIIFYQTLESEYVRQHEPIPVE